MIVQALIGAQPLTTASVVSGINSAQGGYAFEGTLRSASSAASRPHENAATKSSRSERGEESESGFAEAQQNVAVRQNAEFAGGLIQIAGSRPETLSPSMEIAADQTLEAQNGSGFPAVSLSNKNVAADALLQRDISSDSSVIPQPSPGFGVNTASTLTGKISLASTEAISAATQSANAADMESMEMSVISVSRMQGKESYRSELDLLTASQQNIVTKDAAATAKSEVLAGIAGGNEKALLGNAEMDVQDLDAQAFRKEESSFRSATETADQPESNGKNVTLAKNGNSAVEESFNRSGSEDSDPGIGTQNQALQARQLGAESDAVLTDSSALSKHDVMRQVVSKVSEQATVLEKGNGFEQVVIRLTPESLGELKLNLRMENQHLKVEIMAENSSVRDELLRNSNTLKDALARQNITMNSFDVSTGDNGNGSSAFSREDWRELAQQQRASWNFVGNYQADGMNIKTVPGVYRVPAEHSMVDLHF